MTQKSKIPRLPGLFFRWYCKPEMYEELHGDLEEFFYDRVEEKGLAKARLMYVWDVLKCCQPYSWKVFSKPYNHNFYMLTNHLKIAFRSLKKDSVFSLINILGLTIGIAFSCMLYIYVNGELSYDNFHEDSEKIFRIITEDHRVPDQVSSYAIAQPPLAPTLKENVPQVEDYVNLYQPSGQVVFRVESENHQERKWYITDQSFFDFFDLELLYGDESTCLSEPLSVVLSEEAAIEYFGKKDIVGTTFEVGRENFVTITGVFKSPAQNTHLDIKMLYSRIGSIEDWQKRTTNWGNFNAYSYIKLSSPDDLPRLMEQMKIIEEEYYGDFRGGLTTSFQNIEDIYLKSSDFRGTGLETKLGNINYIYIFSTMGLLIPIIACINYVNLTTSKASFRSKEIGIRKVIGAQRESLTWQFMIESLLVTFLAMVLGLIVMDLVLPFFNRITDTNYDLNFNTLFFFLKPASLIALLITLFAGAYPAFYLSNFKPIDSLRNNAGSLTGSGLLRKILVIFQFAVTMILLVSTLVINNQLKFIQEKDIGFDEDRLIVIDINSGNVRNKFQTMKNELEQIPGVSSVGVSSRVPGEWKNITQIFVEKPVSDQFNKDSIQSYFMGFDEGMMDTYGFEMQSGSYFGNNSAADSTQVLLNEAAVNALGLEDPIGKTLVANGQRFRARIAGVVKDFHFQSLHQKIEPLVIGTWNNPVRVIDYFTLKVSGDIQEVLAGANAVHEKFDTFSSMEYNFLDDRLADFYEQEQKAGMIFRMGAILSIFVACLGLFGLASFIVHKREKELGIRKVLGAKVSSLFMLLTSSFTRQIGISFVIAAPIAYLMMSEWLASFEYRISIGIWVFLLSGVIALSIALITIAYRSLKVVRSNPVRSLRDE